MKNGGPPSVCYKFTEIEVESNELSMISLLYNDHILNLTEV